jgi:hypothetical protein
MSLEYSQYLEKYLWPNFEVLVVLVTLVVYTY